VVRGRRRLQTLSLATMGALVAVGAALVPVAPAQEQQIGLLFAQTAERGRMKPIDGTTPRFNLKLRGVNPQVVWFQDRPGRQSGQLPIPGFTRSWAGFGFVDDPPNAALTLLQAGDSQDTLVMELGRPHYKKKKRTIRYSAQLLDEATGNLSYLNSDLDPRVNRRFRAPSLFIDDATGQVLGGCVIRPYTICERANLSGVDLTGVDLTKADLFGAFLRGAILRGAILRNADLGQADLFMANLSQAALNRAGLSQAGLRLADLSGANLTRADLLAANLSQADLRGADLTGANLTGANLTGARLCQTQMPDGSINNRDC
jgi:uncharacterized protein YjbI with pentapeptide repeats